jgi:hypothetical protein
MDPVVPIKKTGQALPAWPYFVDQLGKHTPPQRAVADLSLPVASLG